MAADSGWFHHVEGACLKITKLCCSVEEFCSSSESLVYVLPPASGLQPSVCLCQLQNNYW